MRNPSAEEIQASHIRDYLRANDPTTNWNIVPFKILFDAVIKELAKEHPVGSPTLQFVWKVGKTEAELKSIFYPPSITSVNVTTDKCFIIQFDYTSIWVGTEEPQRFGTEVPFVLPAVWAGLPEAYQNNIAAGAWIKAYLMAAATAVETNTSLLPAPVPVQ